MGTDLNPSTSRQIEENNSLLPILDYLQSPQGHEIAARMLTVIEDVKKSTLEKTTGHAAFEKWLQAGIIFIVVAASSILSFLGKFDTSLGVLFGTLVGYIFGKK
jgi:hypothetical protein